MHVAVSLCAYSSRDGGFADHIAAYDEARGEPRGKIRRGQPVDDKKTGDCIDCYQCVQCAYRVDIRQGQQLGCITCGLCIDACDSIMDKVSRPRGLIRYASLDELEGRPVHKLYQHPRTWVYVAILVLALGGIIYG